MHTSGRHTRPSSLAPSRQALFAARSPPSATSPTARVAAISGAESTVAGLGDRRFLDSMPSSLPGVPDGDADKDGTWLGDVITVNACRGATDLALTGLVYCGADDSSLLLPSCLLVLFGEHALGSSAPRTRRLVGDDAFIFSSIEKACLTPNWIFSRTDNRRQG